MSIQDDDRTEADDQIESSNPAGDNTHVLLADVAGTNASLTQAVVIPMLAVFTALVAGAVVLVITDPELWEIFGSLEWFSASLSLIHI